MLGNKRLIVSKVLPVPETPEPPQALQKFMVTSTI